MADNGRKIPLFMIIALIVVGLVLAGGVSYYIATKVIASQTTEKKQAREPGTFIKLGDPKEGLILNIGGVNSGRYLKIGIILEVKPDKKAPPKEGKNPSPDEIKMLDTVIFVLRSQKVEDFEPAKQEALKELIKNEVNKALGEERVLDVYITNFVLQ
ncbi:flagellar basal body-associated protein FliL [Thermosinus carboxydivorans Nor1]|uniref:Flagellar protein FliL n=1 Tax=Thermosinus carboxydivorans Nor1 TaxID=401526 RepID=A1HN29_9FIRM|nr:flagellar basal body-associated FliL family protein [Thermosinus carboxydivorans]EAX48657.1 flagellar basal body-associated protein FliL [Thermosinus carboxydivorans Nor1]